MIAYKSLRPKIRSVKARLKKAKQSQLAVFLRYAYALKKRSAFFSLSLVILLIPGSNFYLDASLVPQQPQVREVSISLSAPSSYPVADKTITPPSITARSAVVIDAKSASVLFEKNPDEQLMPASTTKIMTALVALEHYNLDDIIVVKRADEAIGQTMKLIPGEKMKVRDLLYGLLLESGNDAAFALAENFPGGYAAFVDEMNKLARTYHLTHTQYRNVSGVEQAGHYTSVRDLARLAAVAMMNPVFAQIVSTRSYVVTDVDGKVVHALTNKNELLGKVPGMRGVKTGWTENAGESLVTDTLRDGNELIVAILRSRDRFGDTSAIIEWAYRAHTWISPEN